MNILIASLLIANLVTTLSVAKTIIKEEVKLNKKISEIDRRNLELLRKVNFVGNEIRSNGEALEINKLEKELKDHISKEFLAMAFRGIKLK